MSGLKRFFILWCLGLVSFCGCSTTATGHNYDGCTTQELAEPGMSNWKVVTCPHPFALLGFTDGEGQASFGGTPGYGAGASWRHAFTDQATREIFLQDGYQDLLAHEIAHARGMSH